jgi:hypothetical protein
MNYYFINISKHSANIYSDYHSEWIVMCVCNRMNIIIIQR